MLQMRSDDFPRFTRSFLLMRIPYIQCHSHRNDLLTRMKIAHHITASKINIKVFSPFASRSISDSLVMGEKGSPTSGFKAFSGKPIFVVRRFSYLAETKHGKCGGRRTGGDR